PRCPAFSPLRKRLPMSHPTKRFAAAAAAVGSTLLLGSPLSAQRPVLPTPAFVIDSADPVAMMVSRLDLEKYKATIKGLTQFGDRREGTDRNSKAVDWIEAQLKSYGCSNTERIIYQHSPAPRAARPATPAGAPGAPGAPGA